jgi:glycerol-3-phosphate dehydrogenase (NAD+)
MINDATSDNASSASNASGKPANAFTRYKAGISDDEREAVRESWEKIMRWSSRRQRKDLQKEDILHATRKVCVMGGGSFGTAIATLLARNKSVGLDVVILVRSKLDAAAINDTHRNAKYLPLYELPLSVRATVDPAEALSNANFIIHAVPVQSSRSFLLGVKEHIDSLTPLLCLSKGLEVGSCQMMSEVISTVLGQNQPLAVLSGPTFAMELMEGLPTAIVAASESKDLARRIQRLFASSCLRVNTSTDVVGVEMSGALKNVLAIAAGIVDGLELGNNALAAVVAQGCTEIRWLAERMGAKTATLAGLSGTGDIMLTCFVPLSRNRTVGKRLGSGETLENVIGSMTQVAEGVATAGAVIKLARRHNVMLPVLTAVARILEGGVNPREVVEQVMMLPQVQEV